MSVINKTKWMEINIKLRHIKSKDCFRKFKIIKFVYIFLICLLLGEVVTLECWARSHDMFWCESSADRTRYRCYCKHRIQTGSMRSNVIYWPSTFISLELHCYNTKIIPIYYIDYAYDLWYYLYVFINRLFFLVSTAPINGFTLSILFNFYPNNGSLIVHYSLTWDDQTHCCMPSFS